MRRIQSKMPMNAANNKAAFDHLIQQKSALARRRWGTGNRGLSVRSNSSKASGLKSRLGSCP